MKSGTAISLIAFFGWATAAPTKLQAREVPQEHSHEQFLTTVRASLQSNNPAGIMDPVFGLLGDAAAAGGKGSIADVECLQQATADQAFTNAKAAGDVNGMTAALVYRALERNTGKVGLASNACTSIKAINPEIAAISQHQDPASANAAATNKAIALALAKQIESVGGDAQTALKSGTFKPGSTSDLTGKGNTCDTQGDAEGCIFSQNLLVEDATAAEVSAAAGGAAASAPAASAAVATAAAATSAASSVAAATGNNVQTFTGTLGGAAPPVINTGGARPFSTDGSTFVNLAAANQRSCSVQNNACADAVNRGTLKSTVAQCQAQQAACDAVTAVAAPATTATSGGAAAASSSAADAAVAAAPAASSASSGQSKAAPTTASAATGKNVQTFTGTLGGAAPPVINSGGARPFSTDGSTFVNLAAANQRSCSVQNNACADAVNRGTLKSTLAQCQAQQAACNAVDGSS